jgi:hypothetical protein
MKNKMSCHGPAFMLARLLSAIVLLLVAFGANAENGDGICFGLYPKSGAIQGTSSCPLIASSNTPVGMATYRCTAELPVVKRWCAAPPDDTSDDRSCPVADPVYASSGATTLSLKLTFIAVTTGRLCSVVPIGPDPSRDRIRALARYGFTTGSAS